MDALKRAEATKRQSQATQSAATADVLSPHSSSAPSVEYTSRRTSSLPELPGELELLDDQFAPPDRRGAGLRPAPQAAAAAEKDAARQAAAQVFAVKKPGSGTSFHVGLGLFTLTAVAAIAAYFWWQLRPSSPSPADVAVPSAAIVAPPSSAADTARRIGPTLQRADSSPTKPGAPQAAAQDIPRPSAAAPARANSPLGARPARPGMTEKGTLADAPPEEGALAPDSSIRITRSRMQVNPAASRGYRQFQSGNLAAARQEYERALAEDPRNADTLDALAAVALRQGRNDDAAAYFQRALETDPRDATAQASLIMLRGGNNATQLESRLGSLTAAQPDAHAAHFALGNVHAAQGQWREAQQAYFQAYTTDPGNPDYQFNLAISLDQLHQPKLALQYYQSALAAAEARPAAFDKAQAQSRARELQQ
jgi:Tfp pilus assembly protein PilF